MKKDSKMLFKKLKASFLKGELEICAKEGDVEEYEGSVKYIKSYFETINDFQDLAQYLCDQGMDLSEAYECILENIFK